MCHTCGKKGHIAHVCHGGKKPPKRPKPSSRRANVVDKNALRPSSPAESVCCTLHCVGNRALHPYNVKVFVNKKPVVMEIDTGAAVSIISKEK